MCPFVSEKQRRYLYANHPEVARQFDKDEKKLGSKKTYKKSKKNK